MRCDCWIWKLSGSVGVVAAVIGSLHAQEGAGIDRILGKWQARQDFVKSFRVEWSADTTEIKGSVSKLVPDLCAPGEVSPPADETARSAAWVLVEGFNMTLHQRQRLWNVRKKRYFEEDTTTAFDGNYVRRLGTSEALGHPDGVVSKAARHPLHTISDLIPVMVTFRATHPTLGPFNGLPLAATGRQALINGSLCPEIEVRGRDVRLWADPARDFTVVRYIAMNKGKIRTRIDIVHAHNDQFGWVPHTWAHDHYISDGTLHRSIRAQVTKLEINAVVPPDSFGMTWPVGTYVHDQNTGERFIQKEGSNVRRVAKNEILLPYDVVAATPEPWRARRLFSWPLIVMAVILLSSAVLLIARQRSKFWRSSTPS